MSTSPFCGLSFLHRSSVLCEVIGSVANVATRLSAISLSKSSKRERERTSSKSSKRERERGSIQNPARERREGREDVDVDEVDDDEKEERRTRIWWRREEGEENELGSDEKTKK